MRVSQSNRCGKDGAADDGVPASASSKHRRGDVPSDHITDARVTDDVASALHAAFDATRGDSPQAAYLALHRELNSRAVAADPSALFDAAFQISRGLRPVALAAHRVGRRRRITPAS